VCGARVRCESDARAVDGEDTMVCFGVGVVVGVGLIVGVGVEGTVGVGLGLGLGLVLEEGGRGNVRKAGESGMSSPASGQLD
jgi:hypothetical protein